MQEFPHIYLAADHRGFALKESLKGYFSGTGFSVTDCGAAALSFDDDYPDFAHEMAWRVARDPGSFGIAICGSGAGVAIAANKVRGIRAGVVFTPADAQAMRVDEDANVIALGADRLDFDRARAIVDAFLATTASAEERHVRRRMKLER